MSTITTYASPSTPRIIGLYTELTSFTKRNDETVTDYLIRAETSAAALKTAGETVSDSLLIAMIIKGLPDNYKSFVAVITQSEKKQKIQDFKVALRAFEETENSRSTITNDSDSILKTKWLQTLTCFQTVCLEALTFPGNVVPAHAQQVTSGIRSDRLLTDASHHLFAAFSELLTTLPHFYFQQNDC